MTRSPDPDTRILTIEKAAESLRFWQNHAEAPIHLAGKTGERLTQLTQLFDEEAAVDPSLKMVSLGEAIVTLFGDPELKAKDVTASWRKFVQLLRAGLEELECPLEIQFHKGRGPVGDRAVWITETLSDSQLLTEEIDASQHILPPPNPRYRPSDFVPQSLAISAIGRTFPHIVDRYIEQSGLSSWSASQLSSLRSLTGAVRPLLTAIPASKLPLHGFWIEPSDRAGTSPDAILPEGENAPVDASRWFSAAFAIVAMETAKALAELAREHERPGCRFVVAFPDSWSPAFDDIEKVLATWPEMASLTTFAFADVEVALLKQLRRARPDLHLAAKGNILRRWTNEEKLETCPSAHVLADSIECQTLSEGTTERLRKEASSAIAPCLFWPKAEDPHREVLRAWISGQFTNSGWIGGSLLVGHSGDLDWPELISLGRQGQSGKLALRAEGPDAEIAEVLEIVERNGFRWDRAGEQTPVFVISGEAGDFRVVINWDGQAAKIAEQEAFYFGEWPLIVIGKDLGIKRRRTFNDLTEAERDEIDRAGEYDGIDGTDFGARFQQSLLNKRVAINSVRCPDLDSFQHWLDSVSRAHTASDPFDQASGIGRQGQYARNEYESLAFENADSSLERLLRWARGSGPRCAVILGEYGAGKTFLARVFCAELREKRRTNPSAGPVPIYIDLRETETPANSHAILKQALMRIRANDHSDATCNSLRESSGAGLILFVLDGFDEIVSRLDSRERGSLLQDFLRLAGSHGRLLLTSRTHLFESQNDEDRHFGGRDSSDNRDGQSEILRFYIKPFTREQIEGALEKRLGRTQAEEALHFIDQIHNLPELAQRPVLLDMIARSLDRLREIPLAEGVVLGATDLYDAFVQEWLDRDIDKSLYTPSEKRNQMGRMALTLWRQGNDQGIPAEALPMWLQKQITSLELKDRELATCNLRTANFLVRDAEGNYKFAHRSFGEYFLATGLVELLCSGEQSAGDGPRLAPEVLAFAVSLLARSSKIEAETLGFLLQKGSHLQAANAVLLLAEWQRSQAATAPEFTIADLSGTDLEGANLAGLSLPNANFSDADLSEASLLDATLPNVNMDRAQLFCTVLSNAQLCCGSFKDANLEQVEARRTDFSDSQAEGVKVRGGSWIDCIWGGSKWQSSMMTSPFAMSSKNVPLPPMFTASSQSRRLTQEVNLPIFLSRSEQMSVAFSPDGTRLLSGSSDKTLRLWDAESGRCLRSFDGHENWVWSVAFSPDGSRLLSGSDDKTLRLWDAESGRCLRSFDGHENWVLSVAFSPDGSRLLSGSSDKTLRLWDAESGRCLRVATSSGISIGADGWPLDSAPPELLQSLSFPSADGHSYSAAELLEARQLGIQVKMTPLADWGKA